MAHYEVQRFSENRWLLDAVFHDRAAALESARLQVSRWRADPPLRVLKVEEHRTGFVETVIYNTARRRCRVRRRRAEPLVMPAATVQRSGRAASVAARRPAVLMLALLVLCGILILDGRQWWRPHEGWALDRPEAQLPNPIRNPWSGQVSR